MKTGSNACFTVKSAREHGLRERDGSEMLPFPVAFLSDWSSAG